MSTPTIWNSPAASVFGFHTAKTSVFAGVGNNDDNQMIRTLINVSNVASWIPGIAIVTGIQKIIIGKSFLSGTGAEGKKLAWSLIGRGVAEILCLGPILMIIDIIVTIGRMIKPFKTVDARHTTEANSINRAFL